MQLYMAKAILNNIQTWQYWEDKAILEIELTEESQSIEIPAEIEVLEEVTGDPKYLNANLARK